jgi:hypothetical protein
MAAFPPIPIFDLTAQAAPSILSLSAGVRDRLGVPANPYWTDAEIQIYVIEALRTWNTITKFWRKRVTFNASPGILFYDLSNEVYTNPVQLPYTVREVDLLPALEYHLLEPPTPTVWTGTDMFRLTDLTQALQRRRDQFLIDSGCSIQQYTLPVTGSPVGRLLLSEAVIDVRRCVFQAPYGTYYQMAREDEFALASWLPFWDRAAVEHPKAWSVTVTPPFQLQLAPAPQTIGILQLLVVSVGPALDPLQGVLLGIPDDLTWIVKWGALADLLGRDSPARDPARAQYCEQRYTQGVELARLYATVLNAQINGRQVRVESVFDLDQHAPNWHNTIGQPNRVAMAGANLLALNKMPDIDYGITLDTVQAAPVTDLTADLGLSPAVFDALIDYAEHLAAFKMGGTEFDATQVHFERLLRLAGIAEERDQSNDRYADSVKDREIREETQRWRRLPVTAAR